MPSRFLDLDLKIGLVDLQNKILIYNSKPRLFFIQIQKNLNLDKNYFDLIKIQVQISRSCFVDLQDRSLDLDLEIWMGYNMEVSLWTRSVSRLEDVKRFILDQIFNFVSFVFVVDFLYLSFSIYLCLVPFKVSFLIFNSILTFIPNRVEYPFYIRWTRKIMYKFFPKDHMSNLMNPGFKIQSTHTAVKRHPIKPLNKTEYS